MNKSLKTAGIILLVLALVAGLSATAARLLRKASPRQTLKAEDGRAIFCEELSFFGSGGKIYGKVYKPYDTLGRKPVLVYCHDLGGNYNEGKYICETVAKKGMVAYSFDFTGGSPESRSAGTLSEVSVRTEVADLKAVVVRLLKEDFTEKRSIYLVGKGLGGAVAGLVASELKKDIAGVVFISARFNIEEFSNETYPKVRNIPDTTFVNGVAVGKKFFTDARDIKIFRKMKRYDGPALVIHGTADTVVPIDFAEKANKVLSGCRLERIDGAGHELGSRYSSKVLRMTMDFLQENVKL